ncbi:AraC family transcriptional regulator [Paenibacillus sp. y28]|uniref:AraC family transcriptional regulator n=1 Tax=Paenibacillus sp. y28 TaxID=3129110 RepID=UPI0030166A03
MSVRRYITWEGAAKSSGDLRFYYAGQEDCAPGHFWGPGIRDHFKFHYVHRGAGSAQLGDRTYTLRAGQGFLIVPGQVAFYQADKSDPWTYSWIAFGGEQAEEQVSRTGLLAHPIFHARGNVWFETLFDQAVKIQGSEKSRDLRFQSLLYRFLGELVDMGPHNAEPTSAGASTHPKAIYVAQAMEFIHMHYAEKISIGDLAELVGIDRKYLSTLFKEITGQSPQAFLLQHRMNQACELIRHSMLTVAEIARSVGYLDPLLFSKMFKRTVGMSPRAYRQRYNGKERIGAEDL